MVYLVSIHPVQDYDVWKAQLDDHRRALGRAGVTRHWLYRGADDPNEVMTVFELPSLEAAGRFLRSAEVGVADWMDRAGLEIYPTFFVGEHTDSYEYPAHERRPSTRT
jgi:hypothetical protein